MSESDTSRIQNNTVGYFGLALELVKTNPSLTLTNEEQTEIDSLETMATELRMAQIAAGNTKFGLASEYK